MEALVNKNYSFSLFLMCYNALHCPVEPHTRTSTRYAHKQPLEDVPPMNVRVYVTSVVFIIQHDMYYVIFVYMGLLAVHSAPYY